MPEMQELPLKTEEIEICKLLKQHEKLYTVVMMIYKQAELKPETISLNTIMTVEKYLKVLKNLDMEIKVLRLQNPRSLPDGVNASNYDEKLNH